MPTFAVITGVPDPKTSYGNMAHGPEVYIEVNDLGICDMCDGSGESDTEDVECDFCKGTGDGIGHRSLIEVVLEEKDEINDKWIERFCRMCYPVFELGEILILDESGREYGLPGRKPSKWLVEYEEYGTVEMAIKRALQVMEEIK